MIKKTVTYDDYNGVERTEDFYFNLTKAECMELELSNNGGFTEMIKRLVSEHDGARIIAIWKDLVLRAYGVKSLDGREFIKNDEVRAKFAQTEAYSTIFMEFATDAEAAAAFVNGIMPHPKTPTASAFPASTN